MADHIQKPDQSENTQPNTPKRMHYDYSRSSNGQSGSHWYSWSGTADPLESQKQSSHQPPLSYTGGMYQPQGEIRRPPPQPVSKARQNLNKRRQQRKSFQQNWAWVIIAMAMLGLTLTVSLVIVFLLRTDGDGNEAFADTEHLIEPTSIIYSNPEVVDDPEAGEGVGGALEGNAMVLEPWGGGESRLTVLVMGMDNRPGEQTCRTDTMIIISLDPQTESIGILSIPRDTYVEIPNHGLQRINTACVLGNLDSPGKGPELAMQTVQYNFGIRVNEYMMVSFQSFISLIDRIGGVDVNNISVINDESYPDMNYGYDPFYLDVGEHHLDGATALKYARSRHNSDDIDRQRRQQEIIFAVRQRVLNLDMLDDLVLQAPGIWSDLEDGIDTSLSLEQIVRLALFAQNVEEQNIHKGVVDWNYLFSYRTPGGASVAVPKRSALPQLMTDVFGATYNQ
ncbi:MAG: LCP family protein [Chloroflexi bacterium]|nr:LCP family protein [Chloroflexota bacterium]